MLFWASPAGDAFQGVSANLAGAHISNWGNLDTLDITDMNPASATLTAMQSIGMDTLTIGDGTHSVSVAWPAPTASAISTWQRTPRGTVLSYHG